MWYSAAYDVPTAEQAARTEDLKARARVQAETRALQVAEQEARNTAWMAEHPVIMDEDDSDDCDNDTEWDD